MIVGKIYTVSEVTRIVKGLFRKEPEFANLQIQGEVSNFRQYPSGHCYFNLKDGKTLLKAVMFAGAARRLKQLPKNGDQVLGVGRIDLYERDGVYQFYVDMMMPLGAGNLMIAYEQLKEKLTAEGLFDSSRKRPLPAYPKVVGIVTSSAGAAVRDIINVAGRRDPSVKLRLYPVKVQGTEAPPEIIRGIRFFNRHKLADVLIVGRGGGSMEDLWAFNDEGVVRAIAASEIPVISAVGHEIDFTLSDFAADLRAPTPSAAAELAVPERSGDRENLAKLVRRLERTMETRLQDSIRALEQLQGEWVFLHPERLWENAGQTLDSLSQRLEQSGDRLLENRQQKLEVITAKLGALDPYGVLRRGYTITENAQGKVVRQASDLRPGDTLVTRFAQGAAVSQVETVKEGKA
ncbi:exodeoxyribonuclease VII large subunit [uncultured Acidaminococcus sp.]|uniref:exodeoxyribonuclease VII large subunit n=1 Tax=uncultured Acidaminococcus sp. TaxID=352152 RepID=UPI0026DC258A|nr:exodeoxyribonuclease VII large subunit [uncultured Acidaminococcus sp.]